MTPDQLVRKVCRYRPYFGKDGGVTFSGGEPLLQSEFICETAVLLKNEGIPYTIDTSGNVPLSEQVACVLRESQEVLLDLKFWDDASYRQYTGCGMQNTIQILSYLNEIGKETRIRTVVVPGINDQEEVLVRYLSHLKGISCVRRYELLPFHTMGFFKYDELGIENPLSDLAPLSPERFASLDRFFQQKRKENG